MFTGIVQALGRIEKVEPHGGDVRLTIACGGLDMADVMQGDSIAVNGVCLTAVEYDANSFQVHVSAETLRCATGLSAPGEVNLEKALRLADRLGGHLVSGHVDGIGEVTRFDDVGDCKLLAIRAPHALSRYVSTKGSITINGVSLTVNTVERDEFTINLIPHTLEVTTLKHLKPGSPVNLEVDLIARYVDRMQQWEQESA
ncbi:riboflavin synthase [Novimethylophilus kurashikiensis]|uniref:Riboflavin synthase n=1 Tax=Novimethylophilus kurashikiensis TaxID=1825523 RepID=A0A2R5FI14_9PROT|nr:riboflavin synthase [Novimethylophilus kurashikiensis]GBG15614.1 riboflavin synthase [Novimethylophilus kurashikiensis]